MNTLKNNDKRSNDEFDRLIFEQKLRIKTLHFDKELDLMLLILNTGSVLRVKMSDYPKLRDAKTEQINEWSLINDGIGIRWESLDEDLSLKGFLKSSALNQMLRSLKGHDNDEMVLV